MSDKLYRKIKVLVASPSDVSEERSLVKEVINEWNSLNAEERRVTLQPILWELDAAPETGERTQEIINTQIVDSCHFAIGIFWTRIGTDTGVAPGGAVEEVERMMSMGKRVMLYFSNAPVARKTIDKEQETKLDKFKELLQNRALCEEYDTLHEFRQKLVRQLDRQVRRWFCQPGTDSDSISFEREKQDLQNDADLLHYQAALKEELGWIRMLGLPDVERVDVNLNDDTFVPLRFSRRQGVAEQPAERNVLPEQECEQPLTPDLVMQDAFNDHRMLLIIGDPGAGKTTLLKYYALSALDSQRCSRLGFSVPVNVFYLPLRDLLRCDDGSYAALPANLSHWAKKNHCTLCPALFEGWLKSETSLVLLDGLDEISEPAERKKVCRWIDGACRGFGAAFFVVTSRGTGYRKAEGIELEVDYQRADVEDFTPEQQERFLTNWFRAAFLRDHKDSAITPEAWQQRQQTKADERTRKILSHLNTGKNKWEQEKSKGLRQLAAVPMILQIMAILWKERDVLPESREKLYSAVLNYLLELRDKRRDIPLLISAERARMVLAPVSLWMQRELKTDEAPKEKMQEKMQNELDLLRDRNYAPPSAADFCDHLLKRAGLLVECGSKEYIFRHKSFREYLAGAELLKKVNRTTGFLDILIDGFGDDWWNEPIRFFIAQTDEEIFDLFMEKLFNSPVTAEFSQKKQGLLLSLIEEAPKKKVDALCAKLLLPLTTAVRQRMLLDCLNAIGKPEALGALTSFRAKGLAKNRDVAGRTEEVLLALGDQKAEDAASGSGHKASPLAATLRIVTLEDRQSSFRNPNEQHAEYIRIPGGSFLYSVTKKEEQVGDLYVAKYPVTNKLYRSFIAYMKSQAPKHEARLPLQTFRTAIDDIAQHNIWDAGFVDYFERGKEDLASLFYSKYDEDRKFGGDDQPVVTVTWYAAKAYCLWLSLLEGGQDGLYHLPSEIEWQCTASGTERRKYPWGNKEPIFRLANYGLHVEATTPVGSYPEGATPEGLYDMAGNVWEWMDDWHNTDKSARSLCGGSWKVLPLDLSCVTRGYRSMNDRSSDIGFRVVRSSPSF